jgi:hypothetical protein
MLTSEPRGRARFALPTSAHCSTTNPLPCTASLLLAPRLPHAPHPSCMAQSHPAGASAGSRGLIHMLEVALEPVHNCLSCCPAAAPLPQTACLTCMTTTTSPPPSLFRPSTFSTRTTTGSSPSTWVLAARCLLALGGVAGSYLVAGPQLLQPGTTSELPAACWATRRGRGANAGRRAAASAPASLPPPRSAAPPCPDPGAEPPTPRPPQPGGARLGGVHLQRAQEHGAVAQGHRLHRALAGVRPGRHHALHLLRPLRGWAGGGMAYGMGCDAISGTQAPAPAPTPRTPRSSTSGASTSSRDSAPSPQRSWH